MPQLGVRYYQAVPPARDVWEADYAAMADAGLSVVVIPAPWHWCHTGEDGYDFAAIGEQLELARVHGLELVVAVDLRAAPLWLVSRHPEYLHEGADGRKTAPRASNGVSGADLSGLCFDNGTVRAHAGRFLRALAAAATHPGLAAYDLTHHWALDDLVAWEPERLYCQCSGSRARFLSWLRRTYAEDLVAVGDAWGCRFSCWDDVAPPRALGQFPAALDWLRFQRDDLATHLRWCVEALREADPTRPVIATGRPPGREGCGDSSLLAREVSAWGCPVRDLLPHEAADRVAAVAPGRKLWLPELPARGRNATRRVHWSLLCSGADVAVHEAWRPTECGVGWPVPALVRPDGTPSARLEAVRGFVDLLAAHPELAAARPCPPEVAVVLLPECQVYWGQLRAGGPLGGGTRSYEQGLEGAYWAFAARGARVVFATPERLEAIPLAYLPLGLVMNATSAELLRRYVEQGGHLVAEGGVASWDELGRRGESSPRFGLDEVFGARAADVPEPVDGEPQVFNGPHGSYPCVFLREPLEATSGRVKASFADGAAAIVDSAFGAGGARLIGTHPSLAQASGALEPCARVILDSLAFARVKPRLSLSKPGLVARLLEGEDALFLCAFNPTGRAQETTVTVSESVGRFRRAVELPTGKGRRLRDNARRFRLGAGEGTILRLQPASSRTRWRPRRRKRR